MKAISSTVAVILIATISITFIGAYLLSKSIIERPTGVEELGISILQAEAETELEWQENCVISPTCSCAFEGKKCKGTVCNEGQIASSCNAQPCLEREHTILSDTCSEYTVIDDCTSKGGICSQGTCLTNCEISCTGSCNYTCEYDWYNDDEDMTNGCENGPPRYSNPIGSSPSNPVAGEIVYHWVNWTDIFGANLDTAILEVNGFGTNCDQTVNVSFHYFLETSEIANISWQVGPNCGEKVIAWRQYANDTANRWNVTELQTYTVLSFSFNITLPGENAIESSGTEPGTATSAIEFNASDITDINVEPCVVDWSCAIGHKQNASNNIPIFTFTNTGNTVEQWNISINQSLPPSIVLYGDTDNNPTDATVIGTNGWIVDNNIPQDGIVNVWLWANFTDASPGTIPIRILHRSMSAS